jgi:exopolysaccharide biosynthesis polyprenyl glycosylphosphotransferase
MGLDDLTSLDGRARVNGSAPWLTGRWNRRAIAASVLVATALISATDPGKVVFDAATAAVGVLLLLAGARLALAARSSLDAQRGFQVFSRRVVPAATAGVVAANHSGHMADAGLVAASLLLVATLWPGERYPLHLTGSARFAFDLLIPAVGCLFAFAIALDDNALAGRAVVPALMWAWMMTFFGGWLEAWLADRRPTRIAVVGSDEQAFALAGGIEAEGVTGFRVVGNIDEGHRNGAHAPAGADIERLGQFRDLPLVLKQQEIDLLIIANTAERPWLFDAVVGDYDLQVQVVEVAAFYEQLHGRVPIGAIDAGWFQCIVHPRASPRAPRSKRLMDVVLAGLVAVWMLPVAAVIAVLVKVWSDGPVLYRQRRVGENGRVFELLKFRTMAIDAEADGRAMWAVADDERITAIGRFLRRTHLDELPQLYNVLRGQMSLVGPRPERPEMVAQLEMNVPFFQRRHLVKPGITGWAQLRCGYSGTQLGAVHKLCHDLYYLRYRSWLFDLLLIIETFRALVRDRPYGRDPWADMFIMGEDAILTGSPVLGAVPDSPPHAAPVGSGAGLHDPI